LKEYRIGLNTAEQQELPKNTTGQSYQTEYRLKYRTTQEIPKIPQE